MTKFTVSSVSELYEALATAAGGDTILLEPGVYDSVTLGPNQPFDVKFPSNVTIKSANSKKPAEIKALEIEGAENLTFDNILFDTDYAGDQVFYGSFRITSSSDITIKDSVFVGELTTHGATERIGYATGKGLTVAGSTGIVIENNEFKTWNKALLFFNNTDITVKGNEIHDISSDGMDFAHNTSVLIEDNYIHDFFVSKASGDHADMIQFWTTGGVTPSTDITIRGNTLDVGEGGETQSIFMRNEVVDLGQAGEEMFYQNILIEENVILNGHAHGITVGETDGLVIRKNSVLSLSPADEDFSLTPQVIVAETSKNVSVQNNVVHGISGDIGQTDWTVTQNAFVQNYDQNGVGFYGDVFVMSTLSGGTVNDYTVLSDSIVANLGTGVGATRQLFDTAPDVVTPMFAIQSDSGTEQGLVFDASYTFGPSGQVLPADAQFKWDFGDGTIGTGQKVAHTYAEAGQYQAKLTVTLADGSEHSDLSDVAVGGSKLLAFDGSSGLVHSHGYGEKTEIIGSDAHSVAVNGGYALDLVNGKGTLEIKKEALSRLFGAEDFEISMNLQADLPDSSQGVVAKLTSSFIVRVEPNGALKVQLWLDTGFVELTTPDLDVNDGNVHDISIELDSTAAQLRIVVDNQLATKASVAGAMPAMGYWDMSFGDSWGGEHFDGKLRAFSVDANAPDYSVYSGPLVPADEVPEVDEGPQIDDFFLDFNSISDADILKDDAKVVETDDGPVITFDGELDRAKFGKLHDFKDSDQLTVSIDFQRTTADGEDVKTFWNHKKLGLRLDDDGLVVRAKTADEGFKVFRVDDIGLNDTDLHNAVVIIDADKDRMQVLIDGLEVLNETDTDFEIVGGVEDKEFSWNLSGYNKKFFDGDISDFRIEAAADFLEESAALNTLDHLM